MEQWPPWFRHNTTVRGYLFGTAAILSALLVRSALTPLVGTGIPNFTGCLAVIAAAWIGGRGPGTFVALGWLPVSWLNWTGPAHAFKFDGSVLASIGAYLAIAGTTIFVIHILRKAEAELQRERDRFAITLGSLDEAVITVDLEDRIQFLNASACALLGCEAHDAIGRTFGERVQLTDITAHALILKVASAEIVSGLKRLSIAEGALKRVDGTSIAVSSRVAPLKSEQGIVFGAVMTLNDITQSKQYEAALQLADSRKDEFLAILAHELRNPLSPLQSALVVIQKCGDDPQKMEAATQIMQRQLNQLVRLVDDLMDVSRIQTGRLELRPAIIDLKSSIAEAVEASRPLFESREQRFIAEQQETVWIRADTARITQILTNLLNNASKYTPARGTITLSCRQTGGEVLVSIVDSGVGLSSDDMRKIFELFTRIDSGKKKIDGLGIGLALSKQLATMHGGRIVVESAGPQLGSTFTLVLPVFEIDAPRESKEVPAGDPQRFRRVLLVDDNVDSTRALATLLGMLNFEVSIANSGAEALESIKAFMPDAAVLDIGLPDITGFELARQMRAANIPTLKKLIALSGWGTKKDVEDALDAGFDAHVTKPITLEQISNLL